jgi:molybdopterin converting factor small subunit
MADASATEVVTNKFGQLSDWLTNIARQGSIDIFRDYQRIIENNGREIGMLEQNFIQRVERNLTMENTNNYLRAEIKQFQNNSGQCSSQYEGLASELKNLQITSGQNNTSRINCQDEYKKFKKFKDESASGQNRNKLLELFQKLSSNLERNRNISCQNENLKKQIEDLKTGDKICRQTFAKNNEELKNIIFPKLDKSTLEKEKCLSNFAAEKEEDKNITSLLKEEERLLQVCQIMKGVKVAYRRVAEKKDVSKLRRFVLSLILDSHPDKCIMSKTNENVGKLLPTYPELKLLFDFLGNQNIPEDVRSKSCHEIGSVIVNLLKTIN